MTDDPDELRYEIEIHLRYGLPSLKLIGWIIAILLGTILWRSWPS